MNIFWDVEGHEHRTELNQLMVAMIVYKFKNNIFKKIIIEVPTKKKKKNVKVLFI